MQIVRASFALAAAAVAVPAFATTQLSSDFSTFANGNLVGQGGWVQQGTPVINPLQVSGGKVVIPGLPASSSNTDNQDARAAFSSNVLSGNGNSIYVGATITVNAVFAPNTTVGSAFILALNTTDASPFQNLRLTTRRGVATDTFQFGVRASGQSQNQPFWTGDLALGGTYNLIVAYNFVTGSLNDTIAGYLNPAATIGASTPWGTATLGAGEAPGFQAAVISQFANATTSQSDVAIGRVIVADSFSEAAAFIPTPGTVALLAFGGIAAARRRRA
jgi:hypothetical protein